MYNIGIDDCETIYVASMHLRSNKKHNYYFNIETTIFF